MHARGPFMAAGSHFTILDGVVLSWRTFSREQIKRRKKGISRKLREQMFFPRRYWRKGRDMLLAAYSQATGITFNIVEVPKAYGRYPQPAEELMPANGYIALYRLAEGSERGWAYHRTEGGFTRAAVVVTAPYIGYLCHEFGHVMGLDHTSETEDTNCCMDYTGMLGYELPGDLDLVALRTAYGR